MKDRRLNTLVGTLLLLLVLSGCEYSFIEPDTGVPVNPEETVSFSTDVEPIWATQKCTACHKGSPFSLLSGEAYQSLNTRKLVNTDSPSESVILTFPGTGSHSTKNYDGNQREIIKVWIQQGAKNN